MSDTSEVAGSLPKAYFLADKITGPFGEMLLRQAGLDSPQDNQDLVVLDDACGIGIISTRLRGMLNLEAQEKLELTCLELSEPLVAYMRRKVAAEGWKKTEIHHANAEANELPSDKYTHVFINFGPTFFKSPASAISEARRVLRSRGLLGLSVWNQVGWWADMNAATERVTDAPAFPSNEEVLRVHTNDPGYANPIILAKTLHSLGFPDAQVTQKTGKSVLESVDEFMAMKDAVVDLFTRSWPQEQKAVLWEELSVAIETFMRGKYGDGPVTWEWTALLATGRKPNP